MKRMEWLMAAALGLGACSSRPHAAPPEAEVKPRETLVAMEEEAQKLVGLKVEPARSVQMNERLQATGTVQPVDSRVSEVRPLARGRVLEVRVRVGDRVKAGQELARFDNLEASELTAQMMAAQSELRRIRVLAVQQARQVERNQRLAAIGAAPRKDYEQSLAERQALEESLRAQESVIAGLSTRLQRFGAVGESPLAPVITTLAAPFAGIVTKVSAAPGEVVEAASGLFTVADISRVWVQAEVYEKDLGRLRVGQAAVIHVDTYQGEPFAGEVTYISDALDPQTRTAKVRCEVANPNVRLKLDMFATVQLPTTFNHQAVAVPVGAIQQLDGRTVVFVRRGRSRFEARAIQAGKTVDGMVEVVSGLKEGEPVVVAGSFHLKSIVAGKELGEE